MSSISLLVLLIFYLYIEVGILDLFDIVGGVLIFLGICFESIFFK